MENAHIHGGGITAANSPDGGAVFTLRLPRDASALMEETDKGESEGDGSDGSKGNTP
jgi:two-component system sensor histidine kinase MtrB